MIKETTEQYKNVETIRLHGDCHAGNILWSGDALMFVDLDDSRQGPAIQDLWMMLSGCLLYTSPSPRDRQKSRMPSSA